MTFHKNHKRGSHHHHHPSIGKIPLNHHNIHTAFLLEGVLTALVIVLSFAILDLFHYVINSYRKEQNNPNNPNNSNQHFSWYFRYVMYAVSYFIGKLLAIYLLMWLFGYGVSLLPSSTLKKSKIL